jgi:phage FluMu protein Com
MYHYLVCTYVHTAHLSKNCPHCKPVAAFLADEMDEATASLSSQKVLLKVQVVLGIRNCDASVGVSKSSYLALHKIKRGPELKIFKLFLI